ncbi:MAG TPA: serine hydrolase domain-containing protein [Iamia sp.]|nr:serine hydrolase domain-containing protein [Iamia sp.]
MRARTLVAAVALLVLGACTRDVEDPPRGEDGAAPGAEPACDPAVEEPLRAWADAGFSGTVTLTADGATTCAAAFGLDDPATGAPHTADSVFAIGSVSKAVTAAAVLDLVAAGDLALDATAGSILPDLAGPAAGATVEQLLVHTSGLSGAVATDDDQPLGHDEAVAALGRLALVAAPGEEVLYADAGYVLLALLVEEAAGEPYRDHLLAEVLTLDDGTVLGGFADEGPGPHWALTGNGDVAMTTAQLARWTEALFAGEVIAPEAVALIEELAVDEGDGTAELAGWVRFDAERFGEPVIAAAGGGGDVPDVAVAAWLPESGRALALASDGTDGVTAEDLAGEILPALVAGDPLPVPPSTAPADDGDLAARAGTYALDGGGHLVVTVDGDRLAVAAEGPAAVAALFPPADADDAAVRAGHEDQVRALLAGETAAGREERAALEGDLGPIERVDVVGTVVAGGELRTYVTITADEEALAWYALDRAGGIAAVEITEEPPTLVLVATGPATYRPDDPTGEGPALAVGFGDATMTLTGPDGAVTARRA